MGKMPGRLETYEESQAAWEVAYTRPDFFVVDDDMYGNSVRVEAGHTLVRPTVLHELVMLLIGTIGLFTWHCARVAFGYLETES